ncbi:adenylylsulfate kinase [Anaeromyxobacter dehalogenans 2CP-1]|uniref:Adenylyl-sulfate kinase n=1 Tax=Anaeromyxobacter dehalogenans (strain ATCC BAA-258 / DSM 21875 / 2CP-1) TaxID=455488 RepID=B8JBC5_ANAD2|nr:adenylyl-sulfate kinase [Anaeromyxobacter dehalogenans]ACL65752.1 adenylylsulfate kinase [Anaeromyxobacter dehalogenans 2CP-1]
METQHGAGFVVWLTGMNRAGKSTLASHLVARLAAAGRPATLLDEDGEAALLLEGLGTLKDDRAKVVARLGFVAKAVMRSGGIAVCAALSPNRDAREQLRREARRFVEVFVDCSMEKLRERDPEGLYAKALAGELKGVPGVDVPYEPPARPEVVVHTDQLSVDECVLRVLQAMVDAKVIGPAEFGRLTGGQRPRRARPEPAAKPKAAKAAPKAASAGGARRKLDARQAARRPPRKAAASPAKGAKRRR